MIYEFISADGRVIEREHPMSEAPPVGALVYVDGVEYRRCLPRMEALLRPEVHYESQSLPRWWKHHQGNFSPSGKPRFSGMREVRESMAVANHHGDHATWGDSAALEGEPEEGR